MKIKYIFVVFTIVFLLNACGNEGTNQMTLTGEFNADNSLPLSTLLTKEYDLQQLRDFFGQSNANERMVLGSNNNGADISIGVVNENFPVECLRYSNNNFYTVYKVNEGGYFYVFWVKLLPQNADSFDSIDAHVYFTAYISSLMNANDFDTIKEGINTAEDVYNLDSAYELTFLLSSGIYSYSLLDDDTVMEIQYSYSGELNSRKDLIVKGKTVCSKKKIPSKLASIRADDLP